MEFQYRTFSDQIELCKNTDVNIHTAVHCSTVRSAVHLVQEKECFSSGFIFDLQKNPKKTHKQKQIILLQYKSKTGNNHIANWLH